jgi:hypothetical protein
MLKIDYSGVHESECFEREQHTEQHTARRLILWLHCLSIPVTVSNPYVHHGLPKHLPIHQAADELISFKFFMLSFWAPRVEPRNTGAAAGHDVVSPRWPKPTKPTPRTCDQHFRSELMGC